jgi:hypothetical protein
MSGKRPTAVSPRQKLRCAVYIYKRAQYLSWVISDLGARSYEIRFTSMSRHREFDRLRPKSVESRCGAVALGSNISVAAPFVRRCLTGSPMAPSPHPAHR